MSVKTATMLVRRAMRVALAETISPANQGSKPSSPKRPLTEAGKVSREFGQELHQRLHAYTGSIDEVGSLGNTAESWRMEFTERRSVLPAANGETAEHRREA